MEIIFNGEIYLCSSIVKGDDYVIAYDETGGTVIEINGISDWSVITWSGGEPTAAPEDPDETIAEIKTYTDAVAVMLLTDEEIADEVRESAEEAVYTKVRADGLIAVPQSGEEWRSNANYIAGDLTTEVGVLYEALRHSKNKQPSTSPQHWKAWEEHAVPTWEELPDGVIAKNTQCTYEGHLWTCTKQHFKSVVYTPEVGSKYWVANQ